MTEKELRKLNRRELLELLLEVSRERESLQEQLDQAKEQLNDRTIALEESGSIAEAALRINHIFEDAEAAAQQYLESLKDSESEALAKAEEIETKTKKYCARMIHSAEKKAAVIEREAREKADAILTAARSNAGERTEDTKRRGSRMFK